MATKGSVRTVSGYAVVKTPGKGSVRAVSGYAVVKAQSQGTIRQLTGYVLSTLPTSTVKTKTGKDVLLDLINNESITKFTWASIGTTFPSINLTIGEKNTTITLTAKPVSGYKGSWTLKYNRISIANYFADVTLKITIAAATTIAALIPSINAAYGCTLVAGDIVDGPVPAGAPAIILTATANSYMFTPNSNVTLGTYPTIASKIAVKDLNGFSGV